MSSLLLFLLALLSLCRLRGAAICLRPVESNARVRDCDRVAQKAPKRMAVRHTCKICPLYDDKLLSSLPVVRHLSDLSKVHVAAIAASSSGQQGGRLEPRPTDQPLGDF